MLPVVLGVIGLYALITATAPKREPAGAGLEGRRRRENGPQRRTDAPGGVRAVGNRWAVDLPAPRGSEPFAEPEEDVQGDPLAAAPAAPSPNPFRGSRRGIPRSIEVPREDDVMEVPTEDEPMTVPGDEEPMIVDTGGSSFNGSGRPGSYDDIMPDAADASDGYDDSGEED